MQQILTFWYRILQNYYAYISDQIPWTDKDRSNFYSNSETCLLKQLRLRSTTCLLHSNQPKIYNSTWKIDILQVMQTERMLYLVTEYANSGEIFGR